jgi:hypothetical protein
MVVQGGAFWACRSPLSGAPRTVHLHVQARITLHRCKSWLFGPPVRVGCLAFKEQSFSLACLEDIYDKRERGQSMAGEARPGKWGRPAQGHPHGDWDSDDSDVPDEFQCPITSNCMRNPVSPIAIPLHTLVAAAGWDGVDLHQRRLCAYTHRSLPICMVLPWYSNHPLHPST